MLRQPIHAGMGAYLKGDHPQLDPYVLPAMQGYMKVDQALFGGIDKLGQSADLSNQGIVRLLRARFPQVEGVRNEIARRHPWLKEFGRPEKHDSEYQLSRRGGTPGS